MEYWEKTYYDSLDGVIELEEKVRELEYIIERADDNQISLRILGTLKHDDDFGYEGKSIEEKLAIAETIYIESIEELIELERELKLKRIELISISRAIVYTIGSLFASSSFTPEQRKFFCDESKSNINSALRRIF